LRIDGLWYAALAGLALSSLAAAEHHGQVSFNGLPVPGVTVTATAGDKKFVAVTDQQGAYWFAELADVVGEAKKKAGRWRRADLSAERGPGRYEPQLQLRRGQKQGEEGGTARRTSQAALELGGSPTWYYPPLECGCSV